jgi:hypothetical protein
MDAALDRRKRLKAMAEGATDVNVEEQGALPFAVGLHTAPAATFTAGARICCMAAGQSKLSNPLVDGPLQGKDAPSFSFYR